MRRRMPETDIMRDFLAALDFLAVLAAMAFIASLRIEGKMLRDWNFIISFADADRIAEARSWAMWVGLQIIGLPFGLPRHTKSVYLTLFLDFQKSGKFQSLSRMQQTVDALWICIFRPHPARERWMMAYSIFCVRLLHCLLVQQRWALPEPLKVGRATSTALTLFL